MSSAVTLAKDLYTITNLALSRCSFDSENKSVLKTIGDNLPSLTM
jgi:hypothetical protein